jgi:transposase-like protein
MASRKRERRTYTAAQREQIVADVRAVGVNAAAKKHGVPQSCVSRWATVGGVKRASTGKATKARASQSQAAVEVTTTRSTAEASAPGATSAPPSPPAERVLRRSRIAKLYTPSQKAEVGCGS